MTLFEKICLLAFFGGMIFVLCMCVVGASVGYARYEHTARLVAGVVFFSAIGFGFTSFCSVVLRS